MAVLVQPEMWFLQGPATDVEANKLRTSAAAFRRMLDGMLGTRQGVVYTRGTCTDLKALATGAPDGFIHVQAGACYVRGTQAASQGMYHLYNDATLDINVLGPNPAHATLDRIDLCVARYQDQFYSGSLDLPTIEMVTGTPSGSPAVPAAPANSLILAQLSIVHASATIPQSVITDRRTPAGIQPVVLDDILIGTDSRYPAATAQATFLNTSNVGTNLIPPGLRHLEVLAYLRGDTAAAVFNPRLRYNNISTATYDDLIEFDNSATTLAAQEQLANSFNGIGNFPAANATAGYFGYARAFIPMYAGAVGNKAVLTDSASSTSDATLGQHRRMMSGKWRTVGAPITRLDVLPDVGNIVVGSHLTLIGHVPYNP